MNFPVLGFWLGLQYQAWYSYCRACLVNQKAVCCPVTILPVALVGASCQNQYYTTEGLALGKPINIFSFPAAHIVPSGISCELSSRETLYCSVHSWLLHPAAKMNNVKHLTVYFSWTANSSSPGVSDCGLDTGCFVVFWVFPSFLWKVIKLKIVWVLLLMMYLSRPRMVPGLTPH